MQETMKKLLLLLSIVAIPWPAKAQAPVCLYQDVLSGPAISAFNAAYGENGDGTYIDLYGANFGAAQGGSTVTVNGTAATNYVYWGADNTGDRQQIGIQVPHTTAGTGAVVVTTAGGSCQYSKAAISAYSVAGGVWTFTYTGAQLLAGQTALIQGLTTSEGLTIDGQEVQVLSAGLTSSSFAVKFAGANIGTTSDTGTFSNGGFTVTAGNIWYVGAGIDNDTPGTAFTCANLKNGSAGAGAGGNGSYASPWTLTNLANADTYAVVYLTGGGTSGYTTANGVTVTGAGLAGMTVNLTASAGKVVFITVVANAGSGGVIGNTYTITQAGSTNDATVQLAGYEVNAYSATTQRTPTTYAQCMSQGDVLVFLNGASFTQGDGTNQHTALNIASGGSSPLENAIMARPGATVQLGGTTAFGLRNTGTAQYFTVAGLQFTGSLQNGEAINGNVNGNVAGNIRFVGNTARCPDCYGSVGAISAGQGAANEAAYATNLWMLGDYVLGAGCGLPANQAAQGAPAGITNKQAHDFYVVGDQIEFGWNRVDPTSCAYNGMQINYGSDNHTVGYTNVAIHDNDMAGAVGACINAATVDPSRGYDLVYNNVMNKCGWGTAADGAGTSFHGCISSPSYGASASAGTMYWTNNTCYDASQILNATSGTGTGCFVVSNGLQTNLTTNISNNLCVQPAYTNTGTAGQNVWVSNLNGTAGVTGSNDLFYSATTPANVTLGGLPAFGASGMLNANPVFSATADGLWTNYRLQATSPAIAAGGAGAPALDFAGFTRPATPAMGALEYQALPAGTATDVLTTTATANTYHRLGINVGGVVNYGTGNQLKSLFGQQGGYMAGGYYQTRFYCNAGGTNDTTHWYNAASLTPNGWPLNFWQNAAYRAVTSTGVLMGTGTIAASSANASTGIQFTLGTALTAGCSSANQDVLVVSQLAPPSVTPATFYAKTSTTVPGTAVWGVGDVPLASPNRQESMYLQPSTQLKMFADGATANTNPNSTIATTKWSWNNLNGTYTEQVWLKCNVAGCTVPIVFGRLGGTTYVNTTVSPTTSWALYTNTFTATETGSQLPLLQLTYNCTGTGANTCAIQGPDVLEGSTLAGNASTIFRDANVKELAADNPGSCRFMTGADWSSYIPYMFRNEANNPWSGFGSFGVNGLHAPMSYSDEIALANEIGCDPWITVGQYNSPAAWAALPALLAADPNYQAMVARGGTLWLEHGNEAWNLGVDGSIFSGVGSAYGYLVGTNFAAFRGPTGHNTGYDSTHMQLVIDGWYISSYNTGSWAYNAVTAAAGTANGKPDFIDNAPYTMTDLGTVALSGSNVSATGAPWPDFFAEIANLNSSSFPSSPSTSLYRGAQYATGTLGVGSAIYEMNCNLTTGTGLTQTQIDQIAGSIGCAMTTVMDGVLAQTQSGFTGPINLFTQAQDFYTYNCVSGVCPANVVTPIWGEARTRQCGPGQVGCVNYDRPEEILMRLWNTATVGKTCILSHTLTSPTYSYAGGQSIGSGNTIAANPAVPYVVTALVSDCGNNYAYLAFNTNLTTAEAITMSGAAAPTGAVTRTDFGVSNLITDNNENVYPTATIPTPVVAIPSAYATSGLTQTIAPASVSVFTWSTGSTPTLTQPTFAPAGGTYFTAQSVTLTHPAGSTACYTTDGSTPLAAMAGTCSHGTAYSGAIAVAATQTLKAIATQAAFLNSTANTAAYTISTPTAATPTFSPAAGSYSAAQTVTIATVTAGAAIYYTVDGSTPTTGSAVYSGPITVATTQTVKAIAAAAGYTQSAVGSAFYLIVTGTTQTITINGTITITGTIKIN